MADEANTQDGDRQALLRPDRQAGLLLPKFPELAYNALLLTLVAVLNLHDGDRDSMSDTTYISDRHELSKIWCAALVSVLMFAIRNCVDLKPDFLYKNQLIDLIFFLEIFQSIFCVTSVVVNNSDAGTGFSTELCGFSVGFLVTSSIVKTGFFGFLPRDKFVQADWKLVRVAHNMGTLGYSGYILNLVMYLHSDNSSSNWRLFLISLLILSAFIQVYARIRIVNDNSGGRMQVPVAGRVDVAEPESQAQVAVAVPVAEAVPVVLGSHSAVSQGLSSLPPERQLSDHSMLLRAGGV